MKKRELENRIAELEKYVLNRKAMDFCEKLEKENPGYKFKILDGDSSWSYFDKCYYVEVIYNNSCEYYGEYKTLGEALEELEKDDNLLTVVKCRLEHQKNNKVRVSRKYTKRSKK